MSKRKTMPSDDNRVPLGLRISPDLKWTLKEAAAAERWRNSST